jgi:hypothetical protein
MFAPRASVGATTAIGPPMAHRPALPGAVDAQEPPVSTSPHRGYEARLAPARSTRPDAGRGDFLIFRRSSRRVVFRIRVERSAEVFWSPGDERAAVLDHFGSNEDRLFIVALRTGRREQTIGRQNFTAYVKDPERADYSHLYFKRLTWSSSKRLRFRAEMWAPWRASARPSREVWVTIRLSTLVRRSGVHGRPVG